MNEYNKALQGMHNCIQTLHKFVSMYNDIQSNIICA